MLLYVPTPSCCLSCSLFWFTVLVCLGLFPYAYAHAHVGTCSVQKARSCMPVCARMPSPPLHTKHISRVHAHIFMTLMPPNSAHRLPPQPPRHRSPRQSSIVPLLPQTRTLWSPSSCAQGMRMMTRSWWSPRTSASGGLDQGLPHHQRRRASPKWWSMRMQPSSWAAGE